MGKRREFEKLGHEGKLGQAEVVEIGNRTDTLSYALLAEINTFHGQKQADMKAAHQHFLQEQIKFYQKVRKMAAMRLYIEWPEIGQILESDSCLIYLIVMSSFYC